MSREEVAAVGDTMVVAQVEEKRFFYVFFLGLLLQNLWPTEENEMLRINCSYLRAE